MNVRRQLTLFRMLVAIDALLMLATYLWFTPEQLSGTRGLPLPAMSIPTWQLALVNAGTVVVLYGLLGRIGFAFALKLDLTGIYRKWAGWRAWFIDPMQTGLAVGVAMVAIDRLFVFFGQGEPFRHPPLPLSLYVTAVAGIGEEILFRMFLLGFCALLLDFLLWRLLGSRAILWIANAIAALAFGAAHLPSVMALMGAAAPFDLSVPTLVELFLVDGILGLAAGRWYVKEGLVAAIGVHFWAGIMWHVIGPMFSL